MAFGEGGTAIPGRLKASDEVAPAAVSVGSFLSNGDPRALGLLRALNGGLAKEALPMMPILLSSLRSGDSVIVRQAIITGSNLFCSVLKQMALQLRMSGEIDGWLEDMWSWMLKFKDAVLCIVLEPFPTGEKVLAVKFLEIYILMSASDVNDFESSCNDGKEGRFNISWLTGNHPILNSTLLTSGANGALDLLFDILHSDNLLQSSFLIVVINCLAAVARNRPIHYSRILSQLLKFDADCENLKGRYSASLRYSLRTAFIGFTRRTHPSIVESRDQLLRALRAMNAGEATDQIIRQVERMSKGTEYVSRNIRFDKDDQLLGQTSASEDSVKKMAASYPSYDPALLDGIPAAKRARSNATTLSVQYNQIGSLSAPDGGDNDDDGSVMESDLAPVAKLIAMIGALLSQGERGADSLEFLISKIHPDLLADIVLENMKHLRDADFPFPGKPGSLPCSSEPFDSSASSQIESVASASPLVQSVAPSGPPDSVENSVTCNSTLRFDTSLLLNLNDAKRDPRRDPRLLDPRRAAAIPVDLHSSLSNLETINDAQTSLQLSSAATAEESNVEKAPINSTLTSETELLECSVGPLGDDIDAQDSIAVGKVEREDPNLEPCSNTQSTSNHSVDEDMAASASSDDASDQCLNGSLLESDQHSSSFHSSENSEIVHSGRNLPLYVDLTDEQRKSMHKFVVTRLIGDYKQARERGLGPTCLLLLARLVTQSGADDDTIMMLHEHIIADYHHQKGHDLAIHVLYQLHILVIDKSDGHTTSTAAYIYEKFLLALAKSLVDSLPASDKSFSRLLGEAPILPHSALALLENLCCSHGYDNHKKEIYGDRITQGLGAVWSLILGRPLSRQACLDIALKCGVHPQDEVRSKAIRLVANKLYLLSYASEYIEKFATKMLLSVSESRGSEVKPKQIHSSDEIDTSSRETSFNSDNVATKGETVGSIQSSDQVMSSSEAQRRTSLFFALCLKKPSLLKLVFDIYGESSNSVRQSIHRHVPILLKNLGAENLDLLQIISDPPEGSEHLLMLVLKFWTEEMNPSSDLVIIVKHLYETKVKDASILIPILPSLAKDEVLQIFPRLVDLPLEKFQTALAGILQGSASSGPALSPMDVLVAIHAIDPEKDKIALKKITEACSACFEQRTVFTQLVLEKSLTFMVEQLPLPLLFMRTVIQAVDAFPTLVIFVMGILSTLVSKQIWTMPKLWVGFLKCVSQTQPHSFRVLLELPPPQLESVLTKYSNLREPLVVYVKQGSMKSSLARPTLKVLGLDFEPGQIIQSRLPASIQAPDTGSFHGATFT